MSLSQEELREKFKYDGELTLSEDGSLLYDDDEKIVAKAASTHRFVADMSIFDSNNVEEWEKVYTDVLEKKYQKSHRNFTRKISGAPHSGKGEPPVYLIPRQRGGPSYKDVDLTGANVEDIMFMPISKGYPMQGVSSFTLGPIVGEGLCLVNAAFSKSICLFHLVGGGRVDLRSKNFWRSGKPVREIEQLDEIHIEVDGETHVTHLWLEENEELWFEEWDKWRKHVALCSRGDFHWGNGEDITYRRGDEYLTFVDWKKECYMRPSYDLLPSTPEFKFLMKAWKDERRAIGLVHPMARSGDAEEPVTRKWLRELFDSEEDMSCQPYVVVGRLLGVPINVGEKNTPKPNVNDEGYLLDDDGYVVINFV